MDLMIPLNPAEEGDMIIVQAVIGGLALWGLMWGLLAVTEFLV